MLLRNNYCYTSSEKQSNIEEEDLQLINLLLQWSLDITFQAIFSKVNSKQWLLGGSPVLVVMEGDSRPKVVGSNPSAGYRMDIFHIDLL